MVHAQPACARTRAEACSMSVTEYGVRRVMGGISARMIRCRTVYRSPGSRSAVTSPAVKTTRETPVAASAVTRSVAFRSRTESRMATAASHPASAPVSAA